MSYSKYVAIDVENMASRLGTEDTATVFLGLCLTDAAETIANAINHGPKDPLHGISSCDVTSIAQSLDSVADAIRSAGDDE